MSARDTNSIPAGLSFRRVDRSQASVLANLFQFYVHDMAEWFGIDANEEGRYGDGTHRFWEPEFEVHFAYAGAVPIGFALLGPGAPFVAHPNVTDMDEFFVVRRHRRHGVGRALAQYAWEAKPGRWLVRVFRGNLPALPFWRGAIADYTGGAFDEELREVNGRQWSWFTFDNTVPHAKPSP